MSDNNKPSIGYVVSLCGIMGGLALALMFILGMVPSFEYISPALGGVLIWVIRKSLGMKYGLISYLAVGLLGMLIVPNYEATMMFIFLLGYYPLIREYLQKIKFKVVQWVVKIAVFALPSVAAYMVLVHLFGMTYLLDDANDFGKYGSLVLLAFGAVAFVLYDIFLGLFEPFYNKIIRPKIQKRMK